MLNKGIGRTMKIRRGKRVSSLIKDRSWRPPKCKEAMLLEAISEGEPVLKAHEA